MQVHCRHTIGDLANDMVRITVDAKPDMVKVVRKVAREGNELAKANARRTSGKHARLYPGYFSAEVHTGDTIVGEYGPRKGGQGSLAPFLEKGSINNPPHGNLDDSLDVIGPRFGDEVGDMVEKWFW